MRIGTDSLKNTVTPQKSSPSLGEATLMALDNIDHPTLAQMYGRAFAIMLKNGEGARYVFVHHSFAIKNLNPYFLNNMKTFYQSEIVCGIDAYAAQALSSYGFVNIKVLAQTSNTKSMSLRYEKTDYGRFFYKRIIQGLP